MKKVNKKETKISIDFVLLLLMIVGLVFSLIYIFYTSTAILHSDSVICDVIAHQQRIHHEWILSHWYYGNEFWLFSLSIPTFFFSFLMKNNLFIRQLGIFFTAIIFFVLLYRYGKKFLSKRETLFLLAIFLSGISYSVLDYFYAFSAYLTVIVNSMILLLLYYKSFMEKSKRFYFILSLIITFLLNMGSMRYFPSLIVPFVLTQMILYFISHKKIKVFEWVKDQKMTQTILIFLVSIIGLGVYSIFVSHYHFESRANSGTAIEVTSPAMINNIGGVVESVNNFFGFDNRDHSYTFMTGKSYFLSQHKNYSIYSLRGICNFIKILFSVLLMIIVPILLFKQYKKNDEKINFLLIFNTCSWFIMIYIYVFSSSFFHNYSEIKYFLFNMIISFILGLYCMYKYIGINQKLTLLLNCFLISYILSNLYTTGVVIYEHNQKEIDKRYEIVNVLKKHNLTFGYGDFWTGLITNFLSDYKIEIASVEYYDRKIELYRWYSNEEWYAKTYHRGKTFILIDEKSYLKTQKVYETEYGVPDDIIKCSNYYILIYKNNPLIEILD